MPTESPYMTFYMIAIALFALSDTIYKIFTIKMYMTLTLTFKNESTSNGNTSIESPKHDLLFDDNSNVCSLLYIYKIFAKQVKCQKVYLENEGQGQGG